MTDRAKHLPSRSARSRPAPCRPRRALRILAALGMAFLLSARAPATPASASETGAAETGVAETGVAETEAVEIGVAETGLDEIQSGLRRLIQRARDRVLPSLVHIQGIAVEHRGGQEHKHSVVGSGTLFTGEGHVLTNQHVTSGGRGFRCTLHDRQEVPCTLVGEDPETDLAVLRLELEELEDPDASLPVAVLGDSAELQVGDPVLAMGSPFALSRSVTFGIVSNLSRVFSGGPRDADPDEMELEEGQRTGLYTRWIQHDALIHPGNSGGPLVDLDGRVMGINELGGAALGFAIPSNLARRVAESLVEHGEMIRSWTGLRFRHTDDTGFERGILVEAVVEGGPADAAGLEPGDLLVEVAGRPVSARYAEEVPEVESLLADLEVGEEVPVVYLRDREERRTGLTTEKRPADRGREATLRAWGLGVEEVTPKLARDRRLESTAGALVSGVRSGGPAQLAEPPLEEGDVLRRVDGREVAELEDLLAAYGELSEAEEPVLVEFLRKGKSYLTLVEARREEASSPPRELPKAWIGIDTQPVVEELARALGNPEARGFRITRVYPGTEAAAAGLAVGDVITALEGQALEPAGNQDAGLLGRRVRRLPLGSSAALTLVRDDETLELEIPLERSRLEPEQAPRVRDPDFELTVREVTFFDRDEKRWGEDVRGVLVNQVDPAGWAGLGGLRGGDLIQRIGDRPVAGLEDFERAMDEVSEQRPERLEVVVLREARTQFLFLEPEWTPSFSATRSAGAEEGDDDAK